MSSCTNPSSYLPFRKGLELTRKSKSWKINVLFKCNAGSGGDDQSVVDWADVLTSVPLLKSYSFSDKLQSSRIVSEMMRKSLSQVIQEAWGKGLLRVG